MARTPPRGLRATWTPVRAPLEVAAGPTPRSLAPLAAADPVLVEVPEARLRARIAAFAAPPIYVPASAPAVPGALVRLRLRDRSDAIGEIVWSRREMPLSGVAIRYVRLARPGRAPARPPQAANAWEALLDSADVPDLPAEVSSVLRATASSRAGAADLAKAVSKDEALSTSVIALANSADFRAAEPLKDVRAAVVRLGLERVRSLVLASSVFRVCPASGKRPAGASGPAGEVRVDAGAVWTHSLVAGFSAAALARMAGTAPEDAFLAGLLHDVGKLLLARVLPEQYAAALNLVEERGAPLGEAEEAALGFTHARAGAWLLSKWGLPGPVVTAVASHGGGTVPGAEGGRLPKLASATRAGNLVARALAAGSTCDRRMPQGSAPVWTSLGVGTDRVAEAVQASTAATAAGAGAFDQAGIRPPFVPRRGEATEADSTLRAAAEGAASRRRDELFEGSGADPYLSALYAAGEAVTAG
ncbi:MAG: HDOD domain-containing protein [Planctomycetota bacterium]